MNNQNLWLLLLLGNGNSSLASQMLLLDQLAKMNHLKGQMNLKNAVIAQSMGIPFNQFLLYQMIQEGLSKEENPGLKDVQEYNGQSAKQPSTKKAKGKKEVSTSNDSSPENEKS